MNEETNRGSFHLASDLSKSLPTENTSTAVEGMTFSFSQDIGTNVTILKNGTQNAEYEKVFGDVIFVVNKIIPPIIITTGLIGNLLSFFVLRKAKYAKQSTCVYMRALTFFDSFMLLVYTSQRYLLRLFPGAFWANGHIFCKEFEFVAYLTMSNCHWTLVFMTVDRFIAVAFPLKCVTLCTTSRAKKSVIALAIIMVLFHLQQFLRTADLTANVLKFKCPFDHDIVVPEYEIIYQHLLTVFSFYIPILSLLILNILIVHFVRKNGRKARKIGKSRGGTRQRQERQITVMLLLVTSAFMIAAIPFTLDHIYWDECYPNLEEEDPFYRDLRRVLYEIALTCITLSPALNFYLYCIGCHEFRKDLKSLFRMNIKVANSRSRHDFSEEQINANKLKNGSVSHVDTLEIVCDNINTRL